jgi:hypothetical protein
LQGIFGARTALFLVPKYQASLAAAWHWWKKSKIWKRVFLKMYDEKARTASW